MKASSAYLTLILAAVLLLGGCSSCSSDNEAAGPTPPPDPDPDPSVTLPTPIDEITAEDAELLTQSVMAMVGRLALIGDITTTMVHKGAGLLTNPSRQRGDAVLMPECNASIEPGPGTNQLSYEVNNSGFFVPPGEALRAAFFQCSIEGLLVDGTLEIAAILHSGDLASAVNNWNFQATAVLGPFQINNGNGTRTSYTDKFVYSASRTGGVLTADIRIAADPSAGIIGGLNAEHFLTQPTHPLSVVNYQFRPFRITIIDNDDTGEYSLVVQASLEGDSRLNRYTTSPSSEIIVTVATTGSTPITWQAGKPASFLDVPFAGEIKLVNSNRSIVATVESDGVLLTIDLGSSVVTESIDWSDLLLAPES